jgi:hypothetical protein
MYLFLHTYIFIQIQNGPALPGSTTVYAGSSFVNGFTASNGRFTQPGAEAELIGAAGLQILYINRGGVLPSPTKSPTTPSPSKQLSTMTPTSPPTTARQLFTMTPTSPPTTAPTTVPSTNPTTTPTSPPKAKFQIFQVTFIYIQNIKCVNMIHVHVKSIQPVISRMFLSHV